MQDPKSRALPLGYTPSANGNFTIRKYNFQYTYFSVQDGVCLHIRDLSITCTVI